MVSSRLPYTYCGKPVSPVCVWFSATRRLIDLHAPQETKKPIPSPHVLVRGARNHDSDQRWRNSEPGHERNDCDMHIMTLKWHGELNEKCCRVPIIPTGKKMMTDDPHRCTAHFPGENRTSGR